eukprot:7195206-Pyramimonas_sp.AAC.1
MGLVVRAAAACVRLRHKRPPAQQRPPLAWDNICCWALYTFCPRPFRASKRAGVARTGACRVPTPCDNGPRGEASWGSEVTARSVTAPFRDSK